MSSLDGLTGSESGAVYDADVLQSVDLVDGRPLLPRYDLERAANTLTAVALKERPRGLWRWRELLPVRSSGARISLGEGDTPLIEGARLGTRLGLSRLLVKAESCNPTGSFKARGMAAAVSRNVELGARHLVVPSAGNAGAALAAYAAAAGIQATVLMPVDAPRTNQSEVIACGAALILVEGLIGDCGRVGQRVVQSVPGGFDLATFKEPYRVEGKKTMGLELAEQLGWRLPDVVVYPTGGGTGLVGMWKAFDELEQLGLVGPERPRMVCVQASGCAPIVRAFETGAERASPWADAATRAAGLRVPSSLADRLILDAIRSSNGIAVAVDEGDIDRAQLLAGRQGIGYVGPESGAAVAAVGELAASGWILRDDEVVVFDTGAGVKCPPPPMPRKPPVVDPDGDEIERLLAAPNAHR